jgi:parvulin-like peptidyl-prolyl isomerase
MAKKKSSKGKTISVIVIAVLIVVAAVIGAYYKGLINFNGITEKVAAEVNGEKITYQELDKQYELFFTLVGYPDEYREQITKELYLNQIVVEELILQEAENTGISPMLVSNQEFKAALDNYLFMSGMTTEELVGKLVAKNLTIEDLQDYFKKQIAINDFLNETLLNKIEMSDEEVKQFYDGNIDTFKAQEGQIRARHILVETEAEAKDIIQRLKGGADFDALAKEKSLDTASGANGGELGFFTKDMMVEEFANASFKLKVNEISVPVMTQFGWHVIQRQSNTVTFEEIEDTLNLQLVQEKQRAALQTYIEQLKANAEIETLLKE